jgi:1,2-diacylglycerol 3-alpha-glucosyltransferase
MPGNLFWQRIYRLLFPLDMFKIIKWLPRLKDFDQIIVHLYPLTWLAYLAKKIYKVKYTFWYHGIMDPQFFPYLHERIYIRLQILLTRLTVRNADEAIAVSQYIQQELKKYTGLDSKVVYNKVEPGKFHPGIDGTEIRQQYKLGNDPVILFVGALRPVKGVHLLIQMFNLVQKKVPNARLIIVGSPDYPYYDKELKRLAEDSVYFVGVVSHDLLPKYYATCNVYATCSLWESFNIPLVEAQASGKPAVAWDIGPHPEVIDANGILIEQGNLVKFAEACIEKMR